MGSTKFSPWTLLAAMLLTLSAFVATAQDSKMVEGPTPDGTARVKGTNAPNAYGLTGITRISLLSYAFQGNDPFNDVIVDDGQSYRRFTSNTSKIFSASVSIPSGAAITGIGFDNCDNSAGVMTAHLVDRFGDHQATEVAAVGSTNAIVCGFNSFDLAAPYDFDTNTGHVFEFFINQDILDPTLKFRSAFVEYQLRVSPAPGVATFGDVPTSSPQFQFIEALVDAGITAGCGGGNYCPNNPVTRGQMAVFIAKALGLHFPD